MSTIIDPETVGQLVGASVAAAIGVTLLFSVAIYGVTRASEARRTDNDGAATVYGIIAAVALAACLGAVVVGIIVMTQKS